MPLCVEKQLKSLKQISILCFDSFTLKIFNPVDGFLLKMEKHLSLEDTDSGIVIECDYEQVLPTKGTRVAAPFLTASWDIECFSMTGDFPLAKRTWKKTAKDLINLARDGAHAVNLIINSLSTGQNPNESLPKNMTPIYCQLKKTN